MVDLYGNAERYDRLRRDIKKWPIDKENREYILRYLQNCVDHLSPGRRCADHRLAGSRPPTHSDSTGLVDGCASRPVSVQPRSAAGERGRPIRVRTSDSTRRRTRCLGRARDPAQLAGVTWAEAPRARVGDGVRWIVGAGRHPVPLPAPPRSCAIRRSPRLPACFADPPRHFGLLARSASATRFAGSLSLRVRLPGA